MTEGSFYQSRSLEMRSASMGASSSHARSLDRWIKQHCAWSAQIGAVLFTSKFGILVGEHRARR